MKFIYNQEKPPKKDTAIIQNYLVKLLILKTLTGIRDSVNNY